MLSKILKNFKKEKQREISQEELDAYWNKRLEVTNRERITKGLEPFASVNMMVFGCESKPLREVSQEERLELIRQAENKLKSKKNSMER